MLFALQDEPRRLARDTPFALFLLLAMLPVGALFALHGYSAGNDLPFHLGSWQDAEQQLRHGGWPQWDFMAARSAGEPRFVFYPPISWMLGAALRSFLTPEHAAIVFVLLALASCWTTMYWSMRRITTGVAASVAGVVYALGPYTLFNALERAANAELLAMAWLPLLFVAVLHERPKITSVAAPMALLWLTNVPTAIIGSYLIVLLMLFRLLLDRRTGDYIFIVMAGVGIGIGLAGFFLLPAVRQQASVQIDAAFAEGQSYRDNFLLRHTEHTRRGVIHKISLLTLEEMGSLAVVLGLLYWRMRSTYAADDRRVVLLLAFVAGAVFCLMLPWSATLWAILPKLSVLQFPWRLLCVPSMLLAFAVAMVLRTFVCSRIVSTAATFVLALALAWSGFHQFWLDPHGHEEDETTRASMLPIVERRATNEYTPVGDENDTLMESTPGFRLQMRTTGMAGGANHGDRVSHVLPLLHTGQDARAPGHMELQLAQAELLVLDLRAYPQWHVTRNGLLMPLTKRADGLIAVALPAGPSVVDVRWVDSQVAGWLVTLLAVVLLGVAWRLQRSVDDREKRGVQA